MGEDIWRLLRDTYSHGKFNPILCRDFDFANFEGRAMMGYFLHTVKCTGSIK